MGVTRFSVTVKKNNQFGLTNISYIIYIFIYIYNISTNSGKNMVVYRTVTLQQRNKIVPHFRSFYFTCLYRKKTSYNPDSSER